MYLSPREKLNAIFFLEFSEAPAETETFFHLGRDQIMLSCGHREEK
jgi:hypothetical protein